MTSADCCGPRLVTWDLNLSPKHVSPLHPTAAFPSLEAGDQLFSVTANLCESCFTTIVGFPRYGESALVWGGPWLKFGRTQLVSSLQRTFLS